MRMQIGFLGCLFALALLCTPTVNGGEAEKGQLDAKIIKTLRVSEPVTYKNLSVYFLHSDRRDDRQFLTLNAALEKGLVKVTELQQEQVGKLTIENLSDKPLFLQEGDRVTGGKQDRTIYTSLIVPAKSGKQQIPTFCVEPTRWKQGATGLSFMCNRNVGYAANNVRQASKLLKNQGIVWQNVAQAKAQLMKAVGNEDKTSSLNEAQDSDQVTQSTEPYLESLGEAARRHKDLVGFAFALNGEIQEVNVFPGHAVTEAIFPRMLETYALDAIVQRPKKEGEKAKPTPPKQAVEAMLHTTLGTGPVREEKINDDNRLTILAAEQIDEKSKKRIYRCLTHFRGRPVHLQWLQGPESLEVAEQSQQQNQFNNLNLNELNFNAPASQQAEPAGNRNNDSRN